VWLPGEAWPHRGRVLAAHNATHFDRFGAARYEFGARAWIDTSDLARRSGLPGRLEVLGARIGYDKDKDASRFTTGLSTCRRPGKAHGAACIAPDVWRAMGDADRRGRGVQAPLSVDTVTRVVEYCERDVEILARTWGELRAFENTDADACAVDTTINDRGVWFDRDLARALLRCDRDNAERTVADTARSLGMTAHDVHTLVRSPVELAAVLGTLDARKETLISLAHTPLVRARLALSSIARGKLEAGLMRTSPDGRMRDTHQYYGAHTGRWSGRGMQLQNLPRPAGVYESWTADDLDRAADRVCGGGDATPAEIDLLLRACLSASPGKTLVVCDYSGVEARALAWMAQDEVSLDVFASGRDPYKSAACDVYGVAYDDVTKAQRQIGKIAVLALGYQGGEGAFERFASGYGIDTSALDVPAIIAAWRSAHAASVSFWYACQRAFVRAVDAGRSSWVGEFEFVPGSDGRDVAVYLPSGRPVVYRDACVGSDARGRPQCTQFGQAHPGQWGTVHTYGGKLTENLDQAMCRDLMADALVRAEAAGLHPVMHVHDEIVCEVDTCAVTDAYGALHEIMTTIPTWAAGFPLGAAGFTGRRYRK
jgi:DNA polymerase